jgi:excisionase family DNA binding protein
MISIRDSSGLVLGCLTVKQLSEYFEVSEATVRNWVQNKKLKAFKIGGKLYFEAMHVKMFADERLRKQKINITGTVVV